MKVLGYSLFKKSKPSDRMMEPLRGDIGQTSKKGTSYSPSCPSLTSPRYEKIPTGLVGNSITSNF